MTTEHLVDLLDRPRCQGPAGREDGCAVVGELGDPAVDVDAGDAVEPDVAPAGEHVVVEVGAVAGHRGPGESLGVEGHAVLGPLAEGDAGGLVVDVVLRSRSDSRLRRNLTASRSRAKLLERCLPAGSNQRALYLPVGSFSVNPIGPPGALQGSRGSRTDRHEDGAGMERTASVVFRRWAVEGRRTPVRNCRLSCGLTGQRSPR